MLLDKLKKLELKQKRYSHNYDYLPNEWMPSLRQHQVEAVAITTTNDKGQVISPCGTGKTIIQSTIIADTMVSNAKTNKLSVCTIASHRLILNEQLSKVAISLLINCGINFNILFIGSSSPNINYAYEQHLNLGFTKDECEVFSSLDENEILDFHQKSVTQGRHLLIISTYNSFNKLAGLTVDICLFDEAHTIINDNFLSNVKLVKNIKKSFFFTATRKSYGDDGGMNDKEVFGDVLFDASPALMVIKGEIIPPYLGIVSANDDEKQAYSGDAFMQSKYIILGYKEHLSFVDRHSFCSEKIGAKLLVSCSGIKLMEEIYFNDDLQSFCLENKIPNGMISSEGAYWNKEKVSTRKFLELLNHLDDVEKALVFNVNMLTAGIDLPSITGVMLLRDLGLCNFLQLVGRCLRLFKRDRTRLYNDEITPADFGKYIKPYGQVIIPINLASVKDQKIMIDYLKKMAREYSSQEELLVPYEKFFEKGEDNLDSLVKKGESYSDFELNSSSISLLINRAYQDDIKEHLLSLPKEIDKINYLHEVMEQIYGK